MKYQRFAALVLAAALLLTGCGGAAAPAAPAGSGAASQSGADTAVQTAQKDRITDQWSLEKTVRGEMIGVMKLSIHVPQLVCDSPDAAALNEELAAMYAAEYMDYESDPDAEVPQGEECSQTEINWDAYWYGDCVSLVMRSHDYDDAPWYYSGWCFDFATGRQVSVAEMLQRMGLDPDAVQQQMLREAMQTFDRDMARRLLRGPAQRREPVGNADHLYGGGEVRPVQRDPELYHDRRAEPPLLRERPSCS